MLIFHFDCDKLFLYEYGEKDWYSNMLKLNDEEIIEIAGQYKVTIDYDTQDENELVIRVLSFGRFVKAEKPQDFVELIKEQLIKQYTLEKAEE